MSFIETERLLLRTWILPSDCDEAREVFCSPESLRFYVRGPLAPHDVPAYVARIVAKEERDGFGVWPMVAKQSRELVGACGLSRVVDLGGDVEIDWNVKPSARGLGYATEGASAVLEFAFAEIGLERVAALVDPQNAASIAIANRLNMRYDGIVRAYKRDLLRYVKTSPE